MVKFFVNRRSAVFCFAVLVVIAGIMAYISLPRESIPEIKQPWIFVTTTYVGVSARDIENLVTRVIEEEIEGLEGLDEITSSSQQSLSFIFAKFTSDVDQETALRRVKERVDIAKTALPDECDEPIVQELSTSNWPILITVLSHPKGLAVIDEAANKMEEALKRVKGVLDVNIAGNLEKELAIELDPQKMEYYGFSINDVISAVQAENKSIPGGILKSPAKNYTLSVTGEIKDPEVFEEIIVKHEDVTAPLREVADVSFNWAEQKTYSRLNGKPCISISITKRAGENIIDIVDRTKEVINKLKPSLPVGTRVDISYDESQIIRNLIADLENNIVTAFILVFCVTIFFLGFRNALFVSIAIPFSMLMSFFILQAMGITLNMIVLFSLVLALGMLVDNGIVIVENIFRHIYMGKSRKDAAIEGSKEVALPIFASTLTTCLAFLPIVFMPGVMGDFMSFLPKTVIVVLSCSLVVAIVINPVFCAAFLNISEKSRKKITEGSGTFIRFQLWYEKVVKWAVDRSIRVLIACFIIVVLGFVVYFMFGKDTIFFPYIDPETGVAAIEMPQGTPLDTTDAVVMEIEEIIPNSPASLKNYIATVGRGSDDHVFGGGDENHKANIRVEYKSFFERAIKGAVAIDSLRARLRNITGADIVVKELSFGPPTGNPVSYQITGEDYAILGIIADSILSILHRYPGLKQIECDYEAAKPEILIDIDRRKASRYKLSTLSIASTIRNAISGGTISSFRQGADEYDVIVRFSEQYRNSASRLANLQIVNKDGDRIPLSSVAVISPRSSVGIIQRRNLDRAVQVWADFKENTQNRKVIKKEIDSLVNRLTVPDEYYIGEGGGIEMRKESEDYIGKAMLIALFLVFMVLIAQFNSLTQSLIIMLTVVMSFSGVFWGYFITGMQFIMIMTGIGCIALAGVVVNNGIVLIDYTNLLIRRGMDWKEAIIEAAKTRMRPVLLTAITTILGMSPMAVGISFDFHKFGMQFGSDSGQMWVAFAWAMIFGLGFATVMTLIIVPCLLKLNFRIFPPEKTDQKLQVVQNETE